MNEKKVLERNAKFNKAEMKEIFSNRNLDSKKIREPLWQRKYEK